MLTLPPTRQWPFKLGFLRVIFSFILVPTGNLCIISCHIHQSKRPTRPTEPTKSMGPTWPMGPTIGWKQNRQLGPMHQKSSMTRQLAQLTFHAPSPMSCTLRTISSPFPPLWFGALSQFGGPDESSVMMAILVNRKILVLCNLPDIVNSLRHWMWHYLDIGSFDIARYDGFGRYRLDKKAPQWRQLRAQDSSSWWWLSCCSEPQQRKAALYKPTHQPTGLGSL